jgi:hypothetical protein
MIFAKDQPEPIGFLRLVRPFLLRFPLYQPLGRGKVKLLLHDFCKRLVEPIGSLQLVRPFLLRFSLYQPLGRGKVKLSFAVFPHNIRLN